ncbi:MAG: hypothetical protein D6785_06535 [Planctomycetota bacterium]|nr:MAG: hypothetical protein D6785_06535 [Planctomycetota bacterium]
MNRLPSFCFLYCLQNLAKTLENPTSFTKVLPNKKALEIENKELIKKLYIGTVFAKRAEIEVWFFLNKFLKYMPYGSGLLLMGGGWLKEAFGVGLWGEEKEESPSLESGKGMMDGVKGRVRPEPPKFFPSPLRGGGYIYSEGE